MSVISVEEYVREDGSSPYRTWFNRQNAVAAAKLAVATVRVSRGATSSIKWFGGIGEIRVDWGPGYRIYLAADGDSLIVLFGGGTKATQKADIANARALHAEYKARKRAAVRQR